MKILYDYLAKNPRTNTPVIVDSEDLTVVPQDTLKVFCQKIGIEFDPIMTSWQAGKVQSFSGWPGFHDDVENSKGFYKPKEYNEDHPQIVKDTIAENMPLYNELKENKIGYQ